MKAFDLNISEYLPQLNFPNRFQNGGVFFQKILYSMFLSGSCRSLAKWTVICNNVLFLYTSLFSFVGSSVLTDGQILVLMINLPSKPTSLLFCRNFPQLFYFMLFSVSLGALIKWTPIYENILFLCTSLIGWFLLQHKHLRPKVG